MNTQTWENDARTLMVYLLAAFEHIARNHQKLIPITDDNVTDCRL